MTPVQQREALSRGLGLLGRLVGQGVGEAEFESLHAMPGLAELAAKTDVEGAQTEFVSAFDLGIPPCAGVFIDPQGLVGREVTTHAADAIASSGQRVQDDASPPDHLANLLRHIGILFGQGRASEASAFAHAHVLPWLPMFVVTLQSQATPFWHGVAALALDLTLVSCTHPQAAAPAPKGPAVPNPLLDPRNGLREVAAFLTIPAQCGTFFSRHDIAQLGRRVDLPFGFGTRVDRFETLIRAAAEYDTLPAVCADLVSCLRHRGTMLSACAQGRLHNSWLEPWTTSISTATQMLEMLSEPRAESASSLPAPNQDPHAHADQSILR